MQAALTHRAAPGGSLGDRVVVGVDGTEAGFEAARQARRLVAPGGSLEAFTAVYLVEARLAGWSSAQIAAELEEEAGEANRRGVALAGPRAEGRIVNGPAPEAFMREIEETRATLAVVGARGHGLLSELLLGGVARAVLHDAPCSVLVARAPARQAAFPARIVVGVDASAESEAAVAAARELAARFSAELTFVTAIGGKEVDVERARSLAPVELATADPVSALLAASADADLLVLGHRGLRGLRSLGSVSERVAHSASCSVLVVRPPAG